MRYIDPAAEPIPAQINFSNIPASLNDLLNSVNREADGKIYRGEVRVGNVTVKYVVNALKRKYLNKCGYCEAIEHEPCVEHHRPVGMVTGGAVRNKGYYWLAYEWTNMVASCDTCNERPYKGTQFPVRIQPINVMPPMQHNGDYDWLMFRYNSLYNSRENPAILHPEYCLHPEKHFSFDTDGVIHDLSIEGAESIRVFGLDRKTLNVNRYELYKNYLNDLEVLVRKRFRTNSPWTSERFAEGVEDILFKLINRRNDVNKEFTLFTKYMLDHLDDFFINPFPLAIIQNEIRTAFQDVLRAIA